MRYSLADYILSIVPGQGDLKSIFGEKLSVGGDGSTIGTITISLTDDLWTTESFPTGGYVHNKNLSKVGEIRISINMLSKEITNFVNWCKAFYDGDYAGFNVTLTDSGTSRAITIAKDCLIKKIPDQVYGETAQSQEWIFTCGEINFQ